MHDVRSDGPDNPCQSGDDAKIPPSAAVTRLDLYADLAKAWRQRHLLSQRDHGAPIAPVLHGRDQTEEVKRHATDL